MKINIKVHANSSKKEIKRVGGNSYEIWLKEKPVDNKANIALSKLLKKYFNCKNINLISGFNSRKKIVEIIY